MFTPNSASNPTTQPSFWCPSLDSNHFSTPHLPTKRPLSSVEMIRSYVRDYVIPNQENHSFQNSAKWKKLLELYSGQGASKFQKLLPAIGGPQNVICCLMNADRTDISRFIHHILISAASKHGIPLLSISLELVPYGKDKEIDHSGDDLSWSSHANPTQSSCDGSNNNTSHTDSKQSFANFVTQLNSADKFSKSFEARFSKTILPISTSSQNQSNPPSTDMNNLSDHSSRTHCSQSSQLICIGVRVVICKQIYENREGHFTPAETALKSALPIYLRPFLFVS